MNVTHNLNVKISHQFDNKVAIRKAIFNKIANIPIMQQVYGIQVVITWRTTDESNSTYYADVYQFTDIMVKKHTTKLLQSLQNEIYDQFGPTGLTLIISKPLSKEIALHDDD